MSTNHGDPTPSLTAESERTHALAEGGVLDTMFLKADWSGAVLVLRTPDEAVARAALDSLPMVAAGVAAFELTEIVAPPPVP